MRKLSEQEIKENLESQKLLEKLGLVLNGVVRIPGDEEELLLFEKELKRKQVN